MADETLIKIFGGIGMVTGVFFFLCPGLFIYNIYKGKLSIEKTSGMGLFTSFVGSLLWFSSEFVQKYIDDENDFNPPEDDFFFISNLSGVLISFVAIFFYLHFYTHDNLIRYFIYVITVVNIGFEVLYIEYDQFSFINKEGDPKKRDNNIQIIEWFASGFNMLMYLAPGINIVKVFQTKDPEAVSYFGSLIGLLNSSAWCGYGILVTRSPIIAANVVGAAFCLIQVVAYHIFSKKDPEKELLKKEEGGAAEENDYYSDVIGD